MMASPLLQAFPKSPLAQKTPVFRRLTVGATEKPRWTPSANRLSPNVVRSSSAQLGGVSPDTSPNYQGLHALTPSPSTSEFLNETPTLSAAFGLKHGASSGPGPRYRPSLSETPNNRNSNSAKFWNQASPGVFNSPAVALKFSGTPGCSALIQSPGRVGRYSVDRRRLYHQDSPPEALPPPLRRKEPLFSVASVFPDEEITQDLDTASLHSRKSSLPTPRSTPKIGKGGFGSVFFAKYGGEKVAIKQLYNRSKGDDKAKEESFRAELNAFRLHHPNIVRILTFTSGIVPQVVFEYVGPRNLQEMLKDDTSFPTEKGLLFCREVAEALRYCHCQRVLHLDVKAANVLVNLEEDHCKLGDFGCSRVLSPGSHFLPASEAPAGTLIFQSPEILKGSGVSTKADVYSFGLLIWQCLSRKLPFEGFHPHTIVFLVVSRGLRPESKILERGFKEGSLERRLLLLAKEFWAPNPNLRPEFEEICIQLKAIN